MSLLTLSSPVCADCRDAGADDQADREHGLTDPGQCGAFTCAQCGVSGCERVTNNATAPGACGCERDIDLCADCRQLRENHETGCPRCVEPERDDR